MRVRFSKGALAQLDEILSELNEVNPSAAQRFEWRIRSIVQRIGRFPQGYQEVEERPGVRRVPLVRYPYLMFYRVSDDDVVVLRIIHGARKEPWEDL